jgi:tetratricopeptide (TPR) repeat protein
LLKQQKPKEAQTVIDKALALPDLTDEQKQNTLFLKANMYLYARDIQNSLDNYKKALEASPEGQFASAIKTRISTLERALEMQKSRADETDAIKDESVPSKAESDAKKDESAPNKAESDAKKDESVPNKVGSEVKKDESDGKKESDLKPSRKQRPRQVLASI